MSAREDHQLGSWDLNGDPPEVHGRHYRIIGAGRSQSGRADAGQLAIVSIAAEPGVFGRDLGSGGGPGNVEVVGDLTALAGTWRLGG